MPPKSKKPSVARRRAVGVRRARVYRSARMPVHNFKRIAYTDDWLKIIPSTTTTFGALTFSLDSLPSYTDFTELYDAYRINKVKVEIIPRINSGDMSSQVQMPMFHSVVDHTDAAAPTTLASMMEYENVRSTQGTRVHKRYFTPKAQQELFNSVVGTGYGTDRRNKFIATDNPAIPHYALKWAAGPLITGGSNQVWYALRVTYYFQCKEVK